MNFTDSHSHTDRGEKRIFNPDLENFDFSNPPLHPFSIGIHPWYINTERLEEDLDKVEKIVSECGADFVGEIGIDKIRGVDTVLQRKVFVSQINIASKYKKDIIIHCVHSANEIATELKRGYSQGNIIIHGVRGGMRSLRPLLELENDKRNVYISFGHILTKECVRSVRKDRILAETDTDDNIEKSYVSISDALDEDIEIVKGIIFKNYHRVCKYQIQEHYS